MTAASLGEAMLRGTLGGGLAGYAKPALLSLGLHLALVAAAVGLAGGQPSPPRPLIVIELVGAIPGEPVAAPGDEAAAGPEGSSESNAAAPMRAPDEPSAMDETIGTDRSPVSEAAPPQQETSGSAPDVEPAAEAESAIQPGIPVPAPKPEPEARPAVQWAAPGPIPRRKPEPADRAQQSAEKERIERALEAAKQIGLLPAGPAAGTAEKAETLSQFGTAAGPTTPSPIAFGSGNPEPHYPYAARKRGEQGQVIVRVRVSPAGLVETASIARSSGSRRLDEAALRAVETWRFVPASVGGVPMPGTVDVPVTFRLED